ncbi:uncharacterized protein BKA55DRAFT_544316 [Fusarium redolens]|uniref:Uncharacterized protein n=1 Tax=Fusarium redolens TaxID=48865 RepID=A0A9P9JR20_FUSRE|nr:uncharacterized protein BKA55DRAFT_544316 [Fusarium redolens]KAH7233833.1 hypothetical protein BKA55DRAFT_544316 [Fusarium redolens]
MAGGQVLTGSTYGLDGAFPDHLQPALLRIYAKISAEWHEFIKIDESPDFTRRNESVRVTETNIEVGFRKRQFDQPVSSTQPIDLGRKRCRRNLDSPEDANTYIPSVTADINDVGLDHGDTITYPSTIPDETTHSLKLLEDQSLLTVGAFVDLPAFNLVVCSSCKYAVLADEIKSHLQNPTHRYSYTKDQGQKIVAKISSIPAILRNQDDLRNFCLPPPETRAIPFIEPPRESIVSTSMD